MNPSCSTSFEVVLGENEESSSGLDGIPPAYFEAMKAAAIVYRRRYPKASPREVKRAVAKAFNIKLKKP